MIRNYRGHVPQIASTAYVDPQAVVIGDVVIGEYTSVWPCAVIRGDVDSIRIGARCSIQDGTVIHVQTDEYETHVGDDVTAQAYLHHIPHQFSVHGMPLCAVFMELANVCCLRLALAHRALNVNNKQ